MIVVGLLQNEIQYYAWGSPNAIPDLLGEKNPSGKPWAELWMGAHPKAPSRVKVQSRWLSLIELIRQNPNDILGRDLARKFNNRLPYLFKVLAAAKPLSIQAHPNLEQARSGYARENEQNIALDAPHRNYKDDNHKPECICALTDFAALHGFRALPEIISSMAVACPGSLANELQRLSSNPDSEGLKYFYRGLMVLEPTRQKQVVAEALQNAGRLPDPEIIFWMKRLSEEYPNDIGILSPMLLNLIVLKPGQALFLPAGELHAYLEGLGIELMANSDNVLRGGLTPKHVDLPELLRVVHFEPRSVNLLQPQELTENEISYICPASEFVLSRISVSAESGYLSPTRRGVEILLCTDGEAILQDITANSRLEMRKGTSILVAAAVERYRISGSAVFYKAGTPV